MTSTQPFEGSIISSYGNQNDAEEKMDPSVAYEEQFDLKNFNVADYLEENQSNQYGASGGNIMSSTNNNDDYIIKTKCFYQIKYEQVYGELIIKKDCLVF